MTNIEDLKCSNCRWLVGDLMCLSHASSLHGLDVTIYKQEVEDCTQFVHHDELLMINNNDEDTESLELND